MSAPDEPARRRRLFRGLRARVVVWYLVLFAALLTVAVLTIQQLLLAELDREVDESLTQEIEELRLIADGNDPATGKPFAGDARAVFRTYLQQNVPAPGEAVFTLIGGRPYASSAGPAADLFQDDALVAEWAAVTTGTYGDASSPAGPVRWLAAPVGPGQRPDNTFVVTRFTADDRDDITDAVRAMALASLAVLVVASALGWLAAGRAMRPLRDLERAARRAESSDLSERLPVVGDDEVAQLTRTFNSMLARLEESFDAQRRFLGDVGHDLRTPLTIVRGNLELLPEEPGERAAVVAMCVDEIDRMDRYISDLSLLAKARRPDFLRLGPVEVDALTDAIEARARALGPDREWVVERRAVAVIEADHDRLMQAWLNLVSNAVHHTGPGDRVAIGSEVVGAEARLWVKDSGPGVAEADRARIFERYVRSGAGEQRHPDGSGFGLAIVRAIAVAHGGDVRLVDDGEPGATFVVTVPVVGSGPHAHEAAAVVISSVHGGRS